MQEQLMSRNPITLVRAIGNVAVILIVVVAIAASMLQAPDVWDGWKWLIAAVALIYAFASLAVHFLFPQKVAEAWDEQNTAAYRGSIVFGYWTGLMAFVILLALVWTGTMDAAHAIFWMGPVFALAPPIHYLGSILRGRAE
jgi:hypothetical protein